MPRRRKSAEERFRALEEQHHQLAKRLAEIGPLYDGSVTTQMLRCGKPSCACHRDERRRHGPYTYWTTKVAGKTVSRKLLPDEAVLLEQWVGNRRDFDRTRKKMIALSRKMLPLALEVRASSEAGRGVAGASASEVF